MQVKAIFERIDAMKNAVPDLKQTMLYNAECERRTV